MMMDDVTATNKYRQLIEKRNDFGSVGRLQPDVTRRAFDRQRHLVAV
jgi:hypothetical protein